MRIPKQVEMGTSNHSATAYFSNGINKSMVEQVRLAERQRIARDIHDELGQLLSTMRLNLYRIKTADQSKKLPNEQLKLMGQLIDRAQCATKSVVSDIRNDHAEDLDFINALEQSIDTFKTQTDTHCNLTINNDAKNLQLLARQKHALLSVLQESLTNIIKHADASKVDVFVMKRANHLCLKIKDNGKGLRLPKFRKQSNAFGLIGMHERMAMIGGHFKAKNHLFGGAEMIAKLPL